MVNIFWKSFVFLAVVRSLWLVIELTAMWLLVGVEGVYSAIDRRIGRVLGTSLAFVSYGIGFSWLFVTMFRHVAGRRDSGIESSRCGIGKLHSENDDQSLFQCEPDEGFGLSPVEGRTEVVDQAFPDLAETPGEVNPATGLPMIGDIDVEGNAFGASSSYVDCSLDVDDPFCEQGFMDLSDDWV